MTKSKYEDFRGAKSIDRKPCTSMRYNIASLKTLKPSSIVETSQRLTKGSNNYSSIQNGKSSILSPGTCDKTKVSKDELISSLDNTIFKAGLKSENRDTASSAATKITKNKPTTTQKKGDSYPIMRSTKSFRKNVKRGMKSSIKYPKVQDITNRGTQDNKKETEIKTLVLDSMQKSAPRKSMKAINGNKYAQKGRPKGYQQKSSRNYPVFHKDI